MARDLWPPDRVEYRDKSSAVPAIPADLPVPYAPVRLCVGAVPQKQHTMPPAAPADTSGVPALPERRRAPGADPMAYPLVGAVVSAEPVLLAPGRSSAFEAEAGKMAGSGAGLRRRLSVRQHRMDRTSFFPQPHHRLFPLVLAGGAPAAGAALAPTADPCARRRPAAPPGDAGGDALSGLPLSTPCAA